MVELHCPACHNVSAPGDVHQQQWNNQRPAAACTSDECVARLPYNAQGGPAEDQNLTNDRALCGWAGVTVVRPFAGGMHRHGCVLIRDRGRQTGGHGETTGIVTRAGDCQAKRQFNNLLK